MEMSLGDTKRRDKNLYGKEKDFIDFYHVLCSLAQAFLF